MIIGNAKTKQEFMNLVSKLINPQLKESDYGRNVDTICTAFMLKDKYNTVELPGCVLRYPNGMVHKDEAQKINDRYNAREDSLRKKYQKWLEEYKQKINPT